MDLEYDLQLATGSGVRYLIIRDKKAHEEVYRYLLIHKPSDIILEHWERAFPTLWQWWVDGAWGLFLVEGPYKEKAVRI